MLINAVLNKLSVGSFQAKNIGIELKTKGTSKRLIIGMNPHQLTTVVVLLLEFTPKTKILIIATITIMFIKPRMKTYTLNILFNLIKKSLFEIILVERKPGFFRGNLIFFDLKPYDSISFIFIG